MRIVFCGTGEIGLPALKAIADSPEHEVAAVVTQPDRPAGRDLRPRASLIKVEALRRGIPVVQPSRIRDTSFCEWLAAVGSEVMVVAAYGQILPSAVLGIPAAGCLNIHASLLPRHRGASPIQAAILAGDIWTGITIMWMDEGLDTGDILLASRTAILEGDNAGELHDRLAALAPMAILRALDLVAGGTAPRIPQDPSQATHSGKMEKSDGWLDWRATATELARRVRAMNPWPGASGRLAGVPGRLKIHRARESDKEGAPGVIVSVGDAGIAVGTGRGTLVLEEIQHEGRKRLPAAEFLRGYPLVAGDAFCLD
jgi:methionyl-tRNA formyltransferase